MKRYSLPMKSGCGLVDDEEGEVVVYGDHLVEMNRLRLELMESEILKRLDVVAARTGCTYCEGLNMPRPKPTEEDLLIREAPG